MSLANVLPSDARSIRFKNESLNKMHTAAWQALDQATLPSRKDDKWRYFDPKVFFDQTLEVENTTGLEKPDLVKRFEFSIIFENGRVASAKLPRGMKALSLDEALQSGLISANNVKTTGLLQQMNLASLQEGLYLEVSENIEQPILLSHLLSKKTNFNSNYIYIRTLKNSSCTIFDESSRELALMNHRFEIDLSEASSLCFVQVHETANGEKYQSLHADLGKDANFTYTQLNLGAGAVRQDVTVNIKGEGAHANLQGLYLLKDDQIVDNHTVVNHLKGNSSCSQLYKGILDGKSKAIFDGKIYVAPGADGTNASQLNKNILLSNSCEMNAKPQLEIFADDVKCNHGATLGKFSEEEIFYFQTRGIERSKAIQMLALGFVEDVVQQIKNEKVIQTFLPKVKRSLKNFKF